MKKWLKLTLIALGTFVALFFTVAAFLPERMSVSRSVTIQAPAETVFNNVANLKRWQDWNPWTAKDPEIKQDWSETERGPGATWTWQSEEIGNGVLTVQSLDENTKMVSELQFEGMDLVIYDIWTFESNGAVTKVTWQNESEARYPDGRYFGLLLDSMMGPDLEAGLENLKKLSESK